MGYAGQLIVERSAEELLLEFERTGRPEPFEEIVRRYSGMVYHVCHRICRDKHDAEDATQAVFAALAVGRKKESGEIRAIGPWLRQVARRVSLDIRRGKKRRQRRETLCASDGTAADPAPEPSTGGLDAEEIKQLVKEELERMPVKYRLPLILHYFGGMSQDDMAKELGCRPGTLRVRLHRARNMLAKRLAKRGVAVGAGGVAAVVFMVAVTRAVQAAVTDSLAVQFGYGHAATAGGVIQAATSSGGPVAAAAHGVAASKVKVACALVLVGACVVRAGAEVYEYIRPLQMRIQQSVPVPVNLDQVIKPLFDTLMPPMRVDATPVKGAEPAAVAVAIGDVSAGAGEVAVPAAPVPAVMPVGQAYAGRAASVPAVVARGQAVASGGAPRSAVERAPGQVGPEYSSPVVFASRASSGAASGGASEGGGNGGKVGGAGVSVAAVRAWMPFSMPARISGPGAGMNGGSYVPPVASAPPPQVTPPAGPPVQTPPPVAQGPSTPTTPSTPPVTPDPGTGGSSGGGVTPIASAALVLQPTAPVETPPPPSSGGGGGGTTGTGGAHYVAADSLASSAFSAPVVQFATMAVSPTVARMSLDAAPSTPAPTFRVSEKGLTGTGAITAPSLDNSGVVTATSTSSSSSSVIPVALLDLSDVGGVTNSVDNPANGRNGWYVGPRGKLVLPRIAVEAGTHAYSWGESAGDDTPDLVNSVRMTLHDVAAAGDVRVSLVSPDAPGVPALPAGERVVALWALESDAAIDGGIDLLVRFDAFKAYALGGTDADVRLLDYSGGDGWRGVEDGTLSAANHLIGGRVGDAMYFAVTVPVGQQAWRITLADPGMQFPAVTPEPGCLSLLAGGIFLLSRRRRGTM